MPPKSMRQLQFQCQLAHGSTTCSITGFSRLSELYKAIADSYKDIDKDDVDFIYRIFFSKYVYILDIVLYGEYTQTRYESSIGWQFTNGRFSIRSHRRSSKRY